MIPAFNAESTIESAVLSALDQSHPPLEVIVVDDGSTDSTVARLSDFGKEVRVVRSEHGGIGRARRLGHEAAEGELVAWLDADDIALPQRVELQVDVFRAIPEVVLVSSDFRSMRDGKIEPGEGVREYYDEAGCLRELYGSSLEGTGPEVYYGDLQARLVYGNVVHPPTVMVRRHEFLESAPEPRGLSVAEDWLTLLGIAKSGLFAFVDRPLIHYRISAGQMSGPLDAGRNAREILAATRSIASDFPDLVAREPARWRNCLAARHTLVAAALAETSKREALAHLVAGVRLAGFRTDHLKVLARTLLPRGLTGAVPSAGP